MLRVELPKAVENAGDGDRGPHDVGVSSSSWGYSNSWLVFVRENPNYKWMMNRGTPMTKETSIEFQHVSKCFKKILGVPVQLHGLILYPTSMQLQPLQLHLLHVFKFCPDCGKFNKATWFGC